MDFKPESNMTWLRFLKDLAAVRRMDCGEADQSEGAETCVDAIVQEEVIATQRRRVGRANACSGLIWERCQSSNWKALLMNRMWSVREQEGSGVPFSGWHPWWMLGAIHLDGKPRGKWWCGVGWKEGEFLLRWVELRCLGSRAVNSCIYRSGA